MNRRSIFPAEMFAVGRALAAGFETFRAEAQALAADEWMPWPEPGAYSEGWQVFPLVMATMPPTMHVDFRRNRARCPGSWALLRDPRVLVAGFSRLLRGCHIYPHSDHPAFDVMRFHVGLNNAGNAGMRLPDQDVAQSPGQSYVFDSSLTHEAANLGVVPRDVLLVDFRLSDAELDEVDRLRREFIAAAGGAEAAPR